MTSTSPVLNAKNDDASEAAIIAERRRPRGAVTVSTQMAGRGTDIRLGGSRTRRTASEVAELGGLLRDRHRSLRRAAGSMINSAGGPGDRAIPGRVRCSSSPTPIP